MASERLRLLWLFDIRLKFIFDICTQIAKFMAPTWGPPETCRPQMGPMLSHEPCYQGIFAVLLYLASYGHVIVLFWLAWCIFPYTSALNYWHCGNCIIATFGVSTCVTVEIMAIIFNVCPRWSAGSIHGGRLFNHKKHACYTSHDLYDWIWDPVVILYSRGPFY